MKKLYLVLSILVIALNYVYAQLGSTDIQFIENELEELRVDRDAVGFAIAVVGKNGLQYAKGFGYKNHETQSPVTEKTLFAIGSCTKAFTAAILGKLESANLLSLADSPLKYLDDFSFYNDGMNNQITIEDMMTHSTGLPRHDVSWYLFPSNSKDSLLSRVKYHEPTAGVRQTWQ